MALQTTYPFKLKSLPEGETLPKVYIDDVFDDAQVFCG